MVGLEPTRPCEQRILSPSRLPIPTHRRILTLTHTTSIILLKRNFVKKYLKNILNLSLCEICGKISVLSVLSLEMFYLILEGKIHGTLIQVY